MSDLLLTPSNKKRYIVILKKQHITNHFHRKEKLDKMKNMYIHLVNACNNMQHHSCFCFSPYLLYAYEIDSLVSKKVTVTVIMTEECIPHLMTWENSLLSFQHYPLLLSVMVCTAKRKGEKRGAWMYTGVAWKQQRWC